MRHDTTVLHIGVPIVRFIAGYVVINHTLVPLLDVVLPAIVRRRRNKREFRKVAVCRTTVGECEVFVVVEGVRILVF